MTEWPLVITSLLGNLAISDLPKTSACFFFDSLICLAAMKTNCWCPYLMDRDRCGVSTRLSFDSTPILSQQIHCQQCFCGQSLCVEPYFAFWTDL